jgi:hypothetical protein
VAGGYPTTALGLFDDFQLDVSVSDECHAILNFCLHQNLCTNPPLPDDTWIDGQTTAAGCPNATYSYQTDVIAQNSKANTAGSVVVSVYEGVHPTGVVPAIQSVTPAQAAQDQTLDVKIVGSRFLPGAFVDFGPDTEVTWVVASSTEIDATVSVAVDSPIGSRLVTVANPDGPATTFPWSVVGEVPVLQSLSPDHLPKGGSSQAISIAGSGFLPFPSCEFGPDISCAVQPVGFTDEGFTADVYVGELATVGPREITVTNPDGGVGTATFTVDGGAPAILWLNPGALRRGTTQTVQVAGENLQSGATLHFGDAGISASPCVGSSTLCTSTVTISPHAFYDKITVQLTNPDGGLSNLWYESYVVPTDFPEVYDVNPRILEPGQPTAVTFTGVNFDPTKSAMLAATRCKFDRCVDDASFSVASVTVDSSTQVTAQVTVPSGAESGLWVWKLNFEKDPVPVPGTLHFSVEP